VTETERRYRDQPLSQRREARRAKILEAALDAFGTIGYHASAIEQLCASAGVSTRNFYEAFSSREELLLVLHDDLNARALQAVVEAIAPLDPDDLAVRARAGVSAYLGVVTTDRRWARIAVIETIGVSPKAEEHRRMAIDRFAGVLRAEAARLSAGGLIPKRDYTLTSIALVAAINGLVNTWTADASWDKRVDQVIDEATRLIVLAVTGPA
jgi:AcrR family transcriptional regulator